MKRIIGLDSRSGWFGFKTGVGGLIVGEAMGFLAAARERTVFIYLIRRDIIAQAVSIVKARQTGRWLSTTAERPGSALTFTNAAIADQIAVVGAAMPMLKAYLDRTGRPWLPLAYEDFEGDDKSKAERACLTLGLTAREEIIAPIRPVLERTWDEVNADWVAHFRPDAKTRAVIEGYERLIASIAPGPRG